MNTIRPSSTQFLQAVKLHEKAIAGDKGATKKAFEAFTALHNSMKDQVIIKAYYGSAMSLLGRDSIAPLERVQYATKGVKILDEAVKALPNNVEIRTLRGYVNYQLPEIYFQRTKFAIDDFTTLLKLYEKGSNEISKEFYWKVLFDLGVCYHRLDRSLEAKSYWKILLSETTDKSYEGLIKQEGYKLTDIIPNYKENKKKSALTNEALLVYEKAVNGGKEQIKEAADFFELLQKKEPGNALIKAYNADVMSRLADYETEADQMITAGIKIIQHFDKAVNASPEDIQIRYLRGYHSYRIPEVFFRRSSISLSDFEYLVEHEKEALQVLTTEQYNQVMFDLGCLYWRFTLKEEADSIWDKLLIRENGQNYAEQIMREKGIHEDRELQSNKETDPISEGKRLYALGVNGNKKAISASLKHWNKLFEIDPANPVIKAYYGSSLGLIGQESSQAKNMFSNIIKGMILINQSLEMEPNNNELRLLRAYLTFHLPEAFFQISDQTIEDFQKLIEAFETGKGGAWPITEEVYQKLLFDLGTLLDKKERAKEAKKTWKKLLLQTNNEKYIQLIKERV